MQLPSAGCKCCSRSPPGLAITDGAQMRAALRQNKVEAANNVITQSLHIGVHSLRAAVDCGHCWHRLGDARDVTGCQEPIISSPPRPKAPWTPASWRRWELNVDEGRRHVTLRWSRRSIFAPHMWSDTGSGTWWWLFVSDQRFDLKVRAAASLRPLHVNTHRHKANVKQFKSTLLLFVSSNVFLSVLCFWRSKLMIFIMFTDRNLTLKNCKSVHSRMLDQFEVIWIKNMDSKLGLCISTQCL